MKIQNIFITGGTGDLGSALVKELLSTTTAHVVTNGRDQSKADILTQELNSEEKSRFHFFVADLSSESPDEIAQKAYLVNNGIDMLISNIAMFEFDDVLESDADLKKKLYDTNLGGMKLAESVISLVTKKGEKIILCDIGSTSVIADILGSPFQDTMHYGRTKADVVRHSMLLAKSNPLVFFRAIHPGSIYGKLAKQIAHRYGSTAVISPAITARHAIQLFLSDSEEKIIQEIITSENYFAWSPDGSWYKKEDDIAEKIEGLSLERIVKIPADGIDSFEVVFE